MPFVVNGDQSLTEFRGMGNKRLSMYGYVKCQFVFREHNLTHYFVVLPHEEAAVPLLIGRDLLGIMNIHLCQIGRIKYSINDLFNLNKINKAQIPSKTVVSALKLFDLFRSPDNFDTRNMNEASEGEINDETEVNSSKSDPEVNLIEDLLLCELRFKSLVGVMNLTDVNDLIDYDESILMVVADETDEQLIDIDERLGKMDADDLKSTIVDSYINYIG